MVGSPRDPSGTQIGVEAMITDAGSLWELIERRAAETPDAVLAVDEDKRTMTYREYRDAAERAAAGLAELGVAEGTPVSWQLPTWIESLVLVGVLSRLGAVQNPILPIYRQREVGFVTKQTGAKLLIVPSTWKSFDFEGMAKEIAAAQPGLDVLVVDRKLPDADPASLPPPAAPSASPDDAPVRWAFYTSGTTADPKGAQHTDRTIMASAFGMSKALSLTPDDVSALVFPFTHIGGIGWLFSSMMVGIKSIVIEAFDPATTIPVMRREGVTMAGAGTPFHMAYLAAQRENPGERLFPHARAFPGGGAAKPVQLHYDVKSELGGAGVVSGYGLTECPILAMATVDDPDVKLAETEGRTTPGVDVRVVKLDGEVAKPGEEGEIRVKGPMLFRGYLDSSLDAAAFDEDGWFRTGDLGFQDTDGYIAITGRLKDVIIRKGETISAKDVEDVLFTHPGIGDVAVIGLPDPASGERACAIVVPADPEAPPNLQDVFDFCTQAGLMRQKIPEQLEMVDVLPR
ncbi:MAG: AMP-binding protein, partial [Actinomycetota bacterium]|nr:AMP-binding protein [Actinomycetota bacterium]